MRFSFLVLALFFCLSRNSVAGFGAGSPCTHEDGYCCINKKIVCNPGCGCEGGEQDFSSLSLSSALSPTAVVEPIKCYVGSNSSTAPFELGVDSGGNVTVLVHKYAFLFDEHGNSNPEGSRGFATITKNANTRFDILKMVFSGAQCRISETDSMVVACRTEKGDTPLISTAVGTAFKQPPGFQSFFVEHISRKSVVIGNGDEDYYRLTTQLWFPYDFFVTGTSVVFDCKKP